jgi:hypothetical protein
MRPFGESAPDCGTIDRFPDDTLRRGYPRTLAIHRGREWPAAGTSPANLRGRRSRPWGNRKAAYGLTVLPDPSDRLIVATARTLGLPLVSADARIVESGLVEIVW